MDKRIILGSIIAVAILILVSFTGVVGYQTNKSSTIAKTSPLFTVRSKRAIDRDSKDIACDYIGKGEETNIHLSSRMKRAEQVQKAISIISKMDVKAFNKFVVRIINQEQMNDKETSDVLQILYRIRDNPNDMKYYDTNNIPDDTSEYLSCRWFPGCNILGIIYSYIITFFIITGSIIIVTGILLSVWCPVPSSHISCVTYEICK